MVALLNKGTLAVARQHQHWVVLPLGYEISKNSEQRFWLAEVEKLSPGFIKLSAWYAEIYADVSVEMDWLLRIRFEYWKWFWATSIKKRRQHIVTVNRSQEVEAPKKQNWRRINQNIMLLSLQKRNFYFFVMDYLQKSFQNLWEIYLTWKRQFAHFLCKNLSVKSKMLFGFPREKRLTAQHLLFIRNRSL